MKRFVFIPFSLKGLTESLQTAEKLAKESMLPIRIGNENESFSNIIEIISVPNTEIVECENGVKVNYIHCIDITNEFVDMNECKFFVSFEGVKEEIKPMLKEKHCLRIRNRYNKSGTYSFSLEKDNQIICNGDFVIYDS